MTEDSNSSVQTDATKLFTDWSTSSIRDTFKNRHDQLTSLAHAVMKICFNGIKVGQKSVYLTNEKMKNALAGYDEWERFIPTADVGLHKKFKVNVGILSHIIKRIAVYESDTNILTTLNEKINDNTRYNDLQQMLNLGLFTYICDNAYLLSKPHNLLPKCLYFN